MTTDSCCTCATLLSDTKVPYDPDSEKPLILERRLPCCSRTICALCQYKNERFQTYCPFCQISSHPSALPPEGLRLPPSYTKKSGNGGGETSLRSSLQPKTDEAPPSYDSLLQTTDQRRRTRNGSACSVLTVLAQFRRAGVDGCWLIASLGGNDEGQDVMRELDRAGVSTRYCKVWDGLGVPAAWVLHAGELHLHLLP